MPHTILQLILLDLVPSPRRQPKPKPSPYTLTPSHMLMNPHLMVYPDPHLTFTHHQPQVQPDPRFRGQPLGFGLFVPVQRFGWTEDLVFRGVGVDHIHASAMED